MIMKILKIIFLSFWSWVQLNYEYFLDFYVFCTIWKDFQSTDDWQTAKWHSEHRTKTSHFWFRLFKFDYICCIFHWIFHLVPPNDFYVIKLQLTITNWLSRRRTCAFILILNILFYILMHVFLIVVFNILLFYHCIMTYICFLCQEDFFPVFHSSNRSYDTVFGRADRPPVF